jgi:hypothetical protein
MSRQVIFSKIRVSHDSTQGFMATNHWVAGLGTCFDSATKKHWYAVNLWSWMLEIQKSSLAECLNDVAFWCLCIVQQAFHSRTNIIVLEDFNICLSLLPCVSGWSFWLLITISCSWFMFTWWMILWNVVLPCHVCQLDPQLCFLTMPHCFAGI